MSKTLLLIDDSRVARMIIKKVLKEISPEWAIEETDSGQSGIELIESQHIDAVFLDFHMPGLNGLETAAIIRGKWPKLPIILLTANIQKEMEVRAEELNIFYLTKPINKDKLAEVLKS